MVAAIFSAASLWADASPERKIEMLKIGTETLHNVTVTTTNKEYVFLVHSKGMGNYKVAHLSPDVLVALGYPSPKSGTNSVTAWARQTVSQINPDQVKQVEERLLTSLPSSLPDMAKANPLVVAGIIGGCLLFHIFFSYCFMLICQKAGTEPGLLVWLPLLHLIPLVKAAKMSPVWALAFLIPLLNIFAQVLWSFKIAKARGFGAGIGILLLLPILNLFAFFYLAFSGNSKGTDPSSAPRKGPELMTLEAA